MTTFFLLPSFFSIVIEAKDGTLSLASAFAGHQEGNAVIIFYINFVLKTFLPSDQCQMLL